MAPLTQDAAELHARTGDPATSHAAMAAYDKERMANAVAFVIDLYQRYGPMADYQLDARFQAEWAAPCSRHLYRQARSVARDRGLIRDTGQRVVNPETSRQQILWEACTTSPPVVERCPTCGKLLGRSAQLPLPLPASAPPRPRRSLHPTPPTIVPRKR